MDLGWPDEADQRAWWAFLDLWRALGTGMERQLASVGVSAADYQILAPLAGADAGMRPRELCAATGWDRSRVAHQIRRMEARGLIERDDVAEDARGVIVRLTDNGRETLQRAAPSHVEWVKAHFITVATRDELNTLTELSHRVVARLNAMPDSDTPVTPRGELGSPAPQLQRTSPRNDLRYPKLNTRAKKDSREGESE